MAAISSEPIKSRLVDQTLFSFVFGFTGRVPNRVEISQWIKSPQLLDYEDLIEQACYLDKGFFSIRFSNEDDVKRLLTSRLFFFNWTIVCVIPWEPIFESPKSLQEVHPVWVELVGLPCWLWDI